MGLAESPDCTEGEPHGCIGALEPLVADQALGLILGAWRRIVELNPAAQGLAGHPYPEVLGADAAHAFARWAALARRLEGITDDRDLSFELDGPDPAAALPNPYKANSPLLPSGLLGAVQVIHVSSQQP